MQTMRSDNIEAAVVQMFDPRRCLIVPRITYVKRIISHECDLLICTANNYLIEVEIKTSASDIHADVKKRHQHRSDYIKHLYFAIPKKLCTEANLKYIPADAGVITVDEVQASFGTFYMASYHRRAKVRGKQKISDNDLIFILRNLQMKFWSNLNHKRLKSKQ